MSLKPKQQAFADYYIQTGNAYQSAVKAGYSDNYAKGNVVKLLENVSVQEYIIKRNEELESQKIADIKEVKEFWTEVLRKEDAELKDRLKASEYIAKTNGAFLEKIEHSGSVNSEVSIKIGAEDYGD